MTIAVTQPLRAINVGRLGISGNHDLMVGLIRRNAHLAVIANGLWAFERSLPPDLEIYRISPHLTVALLLLVALTLWTARIYGRLMVAAWYGLRWLSLEWTGVQWVRKNDHNFRVTFYRPKDGSIKIDATTRLERLEHELSAIEERRVRILTEGAKLLVYVAIYALIPAGYVFSYELMNAEVHRFLDQWHFVRYAQVLWFYLMIVPVLVTISLTAFDWLTYICGAQFVPGAKMHDPVIADKTLETMRAEGVHGKAAFVGKKLASMQLGSV
jgi:hypothetical protein